MEVVSSSLPRLSVIVPVYRAERYLDACITSILDQVNAPIEVILVDDGSPDRSGEICDRWALADKRVRVFHQKNGGVSSARNLGLMNARGNYVMFVDSDDSLKEGTVSFLLDVLDKHPNDLLLFGYETVGDKLGREMIPDFRHITDKNEIAPYFAEHFTESLCTSACMKVYRRDLIHTYFDSTLTMGEDLYFNLFYVSNLSSLYCIPKAMYCYDRTNTASLVRNYKPDYSKQIWRVCDAWYSFFKERGLKDDSLGSLCYKLTQAFFRYLYHTVMDKSIRDKKQAIADFTNQEHMRLMRLGIVRCNIAQRTIFHLIDRGHVSMALRLAAAVKRIRRIK